MCSVRDGIFELFCQKWENIKTVACKLFLIIIVSFIYQWIYSLNLTHKENTQKTLCYLLFFPIAHTHTHTAYYM